MAHQFKRQRVAVRLDHLKAAFLGQHTGTAADLQAVRVEAGPLRLVSLADIQMVCRLAGNEAALFQIRRVPVVADIQDGHVEQRRHVRFRQVVGRSNQVERDVVKSRTARHARTVFVGNLLAAVVVDGLGINAIAQSQHTVDRLGVVAELVVIRIHLLGQYNKGQQLAPVDAVESPVNHRLGRIRGNRWTQS